MVGWLKWIEATETGVRIHFSQKRVVWHYRLRDGKHMLDFSDGTEIYSFLAVLGDRFHSHNTPEDGCDYEVVVDNGTVGVKATAYFKGGHTTVFVPAVDALPASGSPNYVTISSSFRSIWAGPIGAVPINEE